MQLYARVCEAAVCEFLARGIQRGSLTLQFGHSVGSEPPKTLVYGETKDVAEEAGRPTATIVLRNVHDFYVRVAAAADIGLAEAFMAGDFDVENAEQLLRVFLVLIVNRDTQALSASRLSLSWIGAALNRFLHRLNSNTLLGSRRNIEAHYDLSNDLFATFLGESWTYSCAYFGAPGMTLDDAQRAKIDMILGKAQLCADTHLLEIGCGWGELAIRAAQRVGCRVTGITLSREQLALARERARDADVEALVQFELVDYRVLAERGAMFDRVVSVEMLEAVGHEYLPEFFGVLERILAPDGLAVVQVITTPEERYDVYRTTTDFVQKHIFPGGLCPSFEAIVSAAAASSALSVEHVQNIGPHYATTLREWRRRFVAAVKSGRVGELGFDELFVRKWTYYLCYCEAGVRDADARQSAGGVQPGAER
eukprot:IDg9123t1